MDKRLRVVLADDHELVLEGLRALLSNEPDIEMVGTATNGADLLALVEQRLPDVVVLDWRMPAPDGLACLKEIRRRSWPTRVLVLTAFGDDDVVQSALESGADGLALKTAPPRHTVEAIRQVGHGNMVFPPSARKWLQGGHPDPGPALTARERDVMELLAKGLSNTEIAGAMSLSENTVKFHLQNVFQKLGVNNRTEAAMQYRARQ